MTDKTPGPKFGQDSRITRIAARSGESTIGIVRSADDPAEIGVVVHEQFPALGIDHLTTVIVDAADLRAALDEHTPAAEPLGAYERHESPDYADGGVAAALIEEEDGVDAFASRLAAFARKFGVPPGWTTAPAVQAWHRSDHRTEHDGTPGQPRIWSPDYKTTETWSTPSLRNVHWSDLVDVTPLAPVRGCPDSEQHDGGLPDAVDALTKAVNDLHKRAEKAERERDEARADAESLSRQLHDAQQDADMSRAELEAESSPLTPDAITDEMVERARVAALDTYQITVISPGRMRAALAAALTEPPARPLDLFEEHRTLWGIREARREFREQGLTYKDVRRIVELAFTPEPPARPEGAEEVERLIETSPWHLAGSCSAEADWLAEHGVRVVGEGGAA